MTWLEKIAAAGAMAASNQFLGTNSLGTPGAGAATPKMPKMPNAATTPSNMTGPLSQPGLAQNTGATLGQETITHGDSQNKANTAPIVPGMIHPAHPVFK